MMIKTIKSQLLAALMAFIFIYSFPSIAISQKFNSLGNGQAESWGDCGRGEFAAACIQAEKEWRAAQAEALKLRNERRTQQIQSYRKKLAPLGFSDFVAEKGSKRNTLQVRNLRAFREWHVDIRAFPLVGMDGTISVQEPKFDVWDTRNGKNRDLAINVNVYRNSVTESEFWRLKVGNFRNDMVVFYKVRKGDFVAPPKQNDLGCFPRPLSFDEGVERGCW